MPVEKTIKLWADGSKHNVVPKDEWKNGRPAWATDRSFPRLELYKTTDKARSGGKKKGCVLVCPGGGYGGLALHEGAPFAELFASHGMVSGVVSYRVAPFGFPAPYADACRAIRWTRAHADELGIDPNRIAIMGFSAGGHLSSTVAIQPDLYHEPEDDLVGKVSARPDRVILGYPVVSMTTKYHTGSAANLLGPNASEAERAKFSNELHVTKESPEAFIFHTADDAAVLVENALMLAAAYAKAGVPCELHSYRSGPHGVGLALDRPALKSWSGLMIDWLNDWIEGR